MLAVDGVQCQSIPPRAELSMVNTRVCKVGSVHLVSQMPNNKQSIRRYTTWYQKRAEHQEPYWYAQEPKVPMPAPGSPTRRVVRLAVNARLKNNYQKAAIHLIAPIDP
jgi:hypothetical protein